MVYVIPEETMRSPPLWSLPELLSLQYPFVPRVNGAHAGWEFCWLVVIDHLSDMILVPSTCSLRMDCVMDHYVCKYEMVLLNSFTRL